MTHSHSGVHAQLDALLSADPQAMFAELVRAGLQALIEAEASAKIGADRYERYVEHLRRVHPERPVPARADFWRAHYAEQERNPGTRCC